jgi:hypothetical protein
MNGPAGARVRQRLGRVIAVVVFATVLGACRLIGTNAIGHSSSDAPAGWTRIATTTHYLVVANVLPGEEMFTTAEREAEHPVEGESILHGAGAPIGPDARHVEAHVYDRSTGLPVDDITPTIVVYNRTTGQRLVVEPTLMQDLNIGAPDAHFGNNVVIPGDSDLSLTVTIGDEEVTLDGHLD